ncbi:hypothetical protein SAMN06265365_102420 [Tistlia consotensis]|uniref:ABC-type transport auxiliary lipoprotein component domain-containing protein n=1 Tax=Tistlia consotensis USBA 355 TaxID=560819 RepID=A0A1Y6C6C3_9PROT|nr:hypothetical protein [Tistlia consotensis]SMF38586.1 hypothetical protein SAMN05428998_11343 [Tistlia consotensis USBA 355]SNR37035.1 hypothetical protein SAMN06265365_102420 [Tistlia consotensis]
MRGFLAAAMLVVLSACAHQIPTTASPASDFASSRTDKIPGHWLATIQPGGLASPAEFVGHACGAHRYWLDATAAYAESLRGTLKAVFQEVEFAPYEPSGVPAGASGVIRVEGTTMKPEMLYFDGLWSGRVEGRARFDARVAVDGPGGRLFGGHVEGKGTGKADGICLAAMPALSAAVSAGMHDMMEDLGERLLDAPKLRAAS